MTPAESQAMIDYVATELMPQVASSSLADVLNAAVSLLETQDIVSRAGLSDNGAGAWAQLTDGSYYLLMIDPKPSAGAKDAPAAVWPVTTFPVIPSPVTEPRLPAKGTVYGHLPTKPMIFLNLDSGDNAASARVTELAGFAAKYGYSDAVGVTVPPDSPLPYGDVEWFKNLADYGVVYINSKGMTLAGNASSKSLGLTAILTKEARDITREMNDPGLWADIQSGRVLPATTFAWTADGEGGYVPVVSERYCVSSSFMSYCGQFDDGSLVYLDGGGFYVLDMAEAFRVRNATLFVGWNAVPAMDSANTAARYLFSRAFGEQILNPPASMPNRPFPFGDAVEGLALRGWNISPSPYDGFSTSAAPVQLDSRGMAGDAIVLFRPTIDMNMYVSSDGKHLHIPGSFGDTRGTVTINGFSVNVEEWSGEDGIVAGIEDWSWGDVVVETGGKRSQAMPLCRWRGHFSASGTNPLGPDWGPQTDLSCTANFRSDLHPYRVTPDAAPEYSHVGADFEPDATGTFLVHAGQYLDAGGKMLYEWEDKSVALDFRQDGSGNATWGIVDFDYKEGTAEFTLSGDMFDIDYQVFDSETGEFLFSAQWIAAPSFTITTGLGMMGTIEEKTATDSMGLVVTVSQMAADPMTDFDNVPL